MVAHPYSRLDSRSYWKTAARGWAAKDFGALYRPKYALDRSMKVATAGSCFAQHIGANLRKSGFNYMDFERPPAGLAREKHADFGYGLFSARYGNVYTTRQLLTLIRFAFGAQTPSEVWEHQGRWFDPLRPTIEPNGFASRDELVACRNSHYAAVRRLVGEIDVFVFTLGLTEAWINRKTGTAYQLCPGTTAGTFDPSRHAFLDMEFTDVVSDMEGIFKWWRRQNPSIRFLLTVSPVPLAATAADRHVVSATIHSKAVLRAAAGYLASRHAFVDYFPSYEIITSTITNRDNFEPDRRSVRASSVAAVMDCFFASHGLEKELSPAPEIGLAHPADARMSDVIAEMRTVCDEAALDVMPA